MTSFHSPFVFQPQGIGAHRSVPGDIPAAVEAATRGEMGELRGAPKLPLQTAIESAVALLGTNFDLSKVTANPVRRALTATGRFTDSQIESPSSLMARVREETGWVLRFTQKSLNTSRIASDRVFEEGGGTTVTLQPDWEREFVATNVNRKTLMRYVPENCFPEDIFHHGASGEAVLVARWNIERVDVKGLAAALGLTSLRVAFPAGLQERGERAHTLLKEVRRGGPPPKFTWNATPIELLPLGGAREIGGAAFQLRIGNYVALLDCGAKIGTLQGPDLTGPHAVEPDGVFITHGHTDHIGAIPAFVSRHQAQRYVPPIVATTDTILIADQTLKDVYLLETAIRGKPEPFAMRDLWNAWRNAYAVPYNTPIHLTPRVSVRFLPAGHLPGAAMFLFSVDGVPKVLYTGDLSIAPSKLLRGASLPPQVDHLIIDSTYAGRVHGARDEVYSKMNRELIATLETGGRVLLSTFKVGRPQEIFAALAENPRLGRGREFPVYFDGGIGAINELVLGSIRSGDDAGFTPAVIRSAEELFGRGGRFERMTDRKAFLASGKPGIVISPSGMCEGPAEPYVFAFAPNAKDLIGITGFQAPGTQGDALLRGDDTITVDGVTIPRRCAVRKFPLSGHLDRNDLINTAAALGPITVSLVHGDVEPMVALANELQQALPGVLVSVPAIGKVLPLEKGRGKMGAALQRSTFRLPPR